MYITNYVGPQVINTASNVHLLLLLFWILFYDVAPSVFMWKLLCVSLMLYQRISLHSFSISLFIWTCYYCMCEIRMYFCWDGDHPQRVVPVDYISMCCVQVWEMSEHGWSALQYDQDGHSMCGFKMKFDSVIKLQIGEVYLNNIVYSERPDHQRWLQT